MARRLGTLPRWVPATALAALPWTWFLLRDPLGLVGDVLAIVLPVLVVVAVGVLLRTRRAAGVVPAVSCLVAGAVAVAGPWTPVPTDAPGPDTAVTVAAANVTGAATTLPALRALAADVLVVSEVDPVVDAELAATHPFHATTAAVARVGVYSRFPLRVVEPAGPDLPGLHVAVAGPAPFDLLALHVPRPWFTGRGGYQATPAEHHRLVGEAAARVARSGGPVLVAGDLNSTDRARDYRTLVDRVGLVDAMRAGWAAPTQVTTWLPFLLRIDHLLVPADWCAADPRRVDLPRSDHVAVTARVGPCAGPAVRPVE